MKNNPPNCKHGIPYRAHCAECFGGCDNHKRFIPSCDDCIAPPGADPAPADQSGEEELKFKACRINGEAYVELFSGSRCLALISKSVSNRKEDWDFIYKHACAQADRLNAKMLSAGRRSRDAEVEKLRAGTVQWISKEALAEIESLRATVEELRGELEKRALAGLNSLEKVANELGDARNGIAALTAQLQASREREGKLREALVKIGHFRMENSRRDAAIAEMVEIADTAIGAEKDGS